MIENVSNQAVTTPLV